MVVERGGEKHVLVITNFADLLRDDLPEDLPANLRDDLRDVYVLDPLVHGPVPYRVWEAEHAYRDGVDKRWSIRIGTHEGRPFALDPPADSNPNDKPRGPINGPPKPGSHSPIQGPDLEDPDFVQRQADVASAMRDPHAPAEEWVNPLGWTEEAIARAEANAELGRKLSPERRWRRRRRRALIDALKKKHAKEFGNSEGFLPKDRNDALRDYLNAELSLAEGEYAERLERTEDGLTDFDEEAAKLGLDQPLWLALDPDEFDGDGRLLLSIGEDPYKAKKRVWLIARQPIDQVGDLRGAAFELLQSIRREEPSTAVILCVGDNTAITRGLEAQTRWVRRMGKYLRPLTTPATVGVKAMLEQHEQWGAPDRPERSIRVLLEKLFGEPAESDPRNAFYSDLAAFRAACRVWQTGEAVDRVYALPWTMPEWQKTLLEDPRLAARRADHARARPRPRQPVGPAGHGGGGPPRGLRPSP